MTTIPTRTEQLLPVTVGADLGPRTTAVPPLAERIRAAFDAADRDRITPIPDDDYLLFPY